MRIDILTVFPEMFRGFLGESMIARAARAGVVSIRTVDLRDFSRDQRRTVDDKPYSGGPGMLMKPEVWYEAVEACKGRWEGEKVGRVVLTTPTGTPYTLRFNAAQMSYESELDAGIENAQFETLPILAELDFQAMFSD